MKLQSVFFAFVFTFSIPLFAKYETQYWFPFLLFNKAPVSFPLQTSSTAPEIQARFSSYMTLVKAECARRPQLQDPKYKIACSLTGVADQLDQVGSKLQKFSTVHDKVFEVGPTLAASALNIDFEALRDFPGDAAKLLILIRTLSKFWPVFSEVVLEWAPQDDLAEEFLRLINPWFTEFSGYAALAKYRSQLVCNAEPMAFCQNIKNQIEDILQVSLVRVNQTPEVKRFLALSQAQKISVLPQLAKIFNLDILVSSTLDDQPGLPWSKTDPANLNSVLNDVLPSLDRPLKPGTVPLNLKPNDFVARLLKLAKSESLQNPDVISARALAYGLRSVYGFGNQDVDADILKKYVSVKIFLDLERKAELRGLTDCTQCSRRQVYREQEQTEVMIGEVSQMTDELISLLKVSNQDTDTERTEK